MTGRENSDDELAGEVKLPGPLGRLERAGASALGLIAAGAGGFAVFETANQVGAAALVIVGSAFLIIGIQGTRLIKLEGAGGSIEMAQHQAAKRVIEHAKKEEDAEVAQGMLEAASIISPVTIRSPRASGLIYEDDVHRALKRSGWQVKRDPVMQRGRAVDFLVEDEKGRTAVVEAKYRSSGSLTQSDVDRVVAQVNMITGDKGLQAGLLIVTNAPLSGELQDLHLSQYRSVKVANWNDEGDDGALRQAIEHVAR